MNFFKKTSVAVTLTVLLVALCCVWGYTRAYLSNQPEPESSGQNQQAGENNLNYFLNRIDDGADLFSMETTDTLARNNLDLSNTYGVVLSLKTANYLNGQDIETYAKNLFDQLSLGSKDMLLVIESSSQAWYLVYGAGLRSYADDNEGLVSLLRESLDDEFFQGGSDAGILALSQGLADWCQETLPAKDTSSTSGNPFLDHGDKVQILSLWDILSGVLFTLLVNIWWIILLLVVLNLVDRHRFREYIRQHPPGDLSIPPVFFRPILFWHRAGSAWYQRMLYLVTEAPFDEDDDDFGPNDGEDGGPFQGGFQGDSSAGPGPDVGPDAAHFQGGAGFQGNPEEAFRQEHRYHGLFGNLWGLVYEVMRSIQLTLQRFLRGGRM